MTIAPLKRLSAALLSSALAIASAKVAYADHCSWGAIADVQAACAPHDGRDIGYILVGSPAPGATAGAGAAEAGPALVDAMRQQILAHLALRPGMVVAEIGLGRGWFVFRAAEAVGPNGGVYATDIDPEAIASMRQQLLHINPAAGHVDVRLCQGPRDTALDDLPDAHVDAVLMVDSLCFDTHEPRQSNVAYLHRFLRVLRPGGRLIHHMDCHCNTTPDAVVAQFVDAGFSPHVESVGMPFVAAPADPISRCETEAARKQAFIAVFSRPTRRP